VLFMQVLLCPASRASTFGPEVGAMC